MFERCSPSRLVLAACLGLVVAGCAGRLDGRVVRYTDNSFYVRHYPWALSDEDVAAFAASECAKTDTDATQISQEQYYALDIRYVTFRCIKPAET